MIMFISWFLSEISYMDLSSYKGHNRAITPPQAHCKNTSAPSASGSRPSPSFSTECLHLPFLPL
ncbi:hypothetical protein, partial [Metapseudomonas otitidis]|uniref:hypothetical protein n=1 Tax=Metapseudomonas otitidis TaxID=319939 RepID=UPI001982152C